MFQAHERICSGQTILPSAAVPLVLSPPTKSNFFSSLNLGKNSEDDVLLSNTPAAAAPTTVRPKPVSYSKFTTIDVSSPLGQYISGLTGSGCENVDDVRDVCASTVSDVGRPTRRTRVPVTFKGYKDRMANKQSSHKYCFTARDRELRMQTIRTGK